jgi:hypothetical protein
MAQDDWRIHIQLGDADRLLDRLNVELSAEARELAGELERRRLAVSRDGDDIFVYAASQSEAEQAHAVIEAELRDLGIEARTSRVEHWLEDEERWDDEPPGETWEEEELDRGYAPWEVRAECASRREAEQLAEQLEGEGYSVVRQFRYLIVGAASKEDAEQLAARLHGRAEPSGQAVWEVAPHTPFAVFGGLAG